MKCLIQNALGDTVVNHYVPMSAANAETFAGKYLDGTWKVFLARPEIGSDTGVVTAYDVNAYVKNIESGQGSYLRFIASATKSDTEVKAALMNITVDGHLIDHVTLINFAPLSFA